MSATRTLRNATTNVGKYCNLVRHTAAETAKRTTSGNRSVRAPSVSAASACSMVARARPVTPPLRRKQPAAIGICKSVVLILWLLVTCLAVHISQFIVTPLYFIDRLWFYACDAPADTMAVLTTNRFMAWSKKCFGVICVTITQGFSPTRVVVTGDESVKGQIWKRDGLVETTFPPRIILMANHITYADWLYLWWLSYSSRMHGAMYIILKKSLKWIPVAGWGMQFFGFIFMSRKWLFDQPALYHRLRQLALAEEDPLWLLIFPEGTNISSNTFSKSETYAAAHQLVPPQHVLLPRARGLHYCLKTLSPSVGWVYDVTMAYEDVPEGRYGQDCYTLISLYILGRPPNGVHMHIRRFAVSDIPLEAERFEDWLRARWMEKDSLMAHFHRTGSFPESERFEAMIQLRHPLVEIFSMFSVAGLIGLLIHIGVRVRALAGSML